VPADLADLLLACRTELATEVGRRRWGRGLDYFLDRCRSATGTERVAIARQVRDFLTEPYGLTRTKAGKSGALGEAVEALVTECTRSVNEDPTPLFAWGTIAEVDSPQRRDIDRFIDFAQRLEPESGAAFTFNPVILVTGPLVRPDWSGLGRLYVSQDGRLASLRIAPPAHLAAAGLHSFLIDSIEAGLDRTDKRTKRDRLPWPTAPHRRLLTELRSNLRVPSL
jgi:hypothetical protein